MVKDSSPSSAIQVHHSTQVSFALSFLSSFSLSLTYALIGKEEEEKIMARSRIGSRPPSCDRRCATCGHCEAVQVPAVPQQRRKDLSSRADEDTNYKPVSWKCQCGGLITDP